MIKEKLRLNNARREILRGVASKLQGLSEVVSDMLDSEEYAFDNMPENIKEGDKGCDMEDAIDNLGNAIEGIDEVVDYILEAIQ